MQREKMLFSLSFGLSISPGRSFSTDRRNKFIQRKRTEGKEKKKSSVDGNIVLPFFSFASILDDIYHSEEFSSSTAATAEEQHQENFPDPN